LNEYVYLQTRDERQHSIQLRDLLLEQLNGDCRSEPLTLAAVGGYFSLYQLPGADKILKREWPKTIGELINQQFYQPLEELRGASAISALTAIDQDISLQVMRQYEQNPYPRWTLDSQAAALTEEGVQQADVGAEILVAGCGTGRHALQVARQYPKAR